MKGNNAKRGDVFVRDSGEHGHIGIVMSASALGFTAIEQNAGGCGVVKHIYHEYTKDIHFLRPINQKNIVEKKNRPTVKAGKTYYFTTEPYVYKDTNKNAFKICDITELNSTDKARLQKGTKVKPTEVINQGKDIWIKFTCYKKEAYALVYNYEKDKSYIK